MRNMEFNWLKTCAAKKCLAQVFLCLWHLCLVQVYLFSTRLEIGFVYLYYRCMFESRGERAGEPVKTGMISAASSLNPPFVL